MPVTDKTVKQDQIGGWEDDGGARPVKAPAGGIARARSDRRAPAPKDVETAAEQKAPLDRDKLKRRPAR